MRIEFTAELSLDAPPEKVWQALVQPERVAEYYLAPLMVIELFAGGGRGVLGKGEAGGFARQAQRGCVSF